MVYRMVPLALVALALFVSTPAFAADAKNAAADKNATQADTHYGTVVSVTEHQLVMKGKAKDGQEAAEHTHKIGINAKVLCDGKECKLEDLKPGQKIRVTTKSGDKNVVVKVEALDKNEKFEKRTNTDSSK
jgi:hypothetical protein